MLLDSLKLMSQLLTPVVSESDIWWVERKFWVLAHWTNGEIVTNWGKTIFILISGSQKTDRNGNVNCYSYEIDGFILNIHKKRTLPRVLLSLSFLPFEWVLFKLNRQNKAVFDKCGLNIVTSQQWRFKIRNVIFPHKSGLILVLMSRVQKAHLLNPKCFWFSHLSISQSSRGTPFSPKFLI